MRSSEQRARPRQYESHVHPETSVCDPRGEDGFAFSGNRSRVSVERLEAPFGFASSRRFDKRKARCVGVYTVRCLVRRSIQSSRSHACGTWPCQTTRSTQGLAPQPPSGLTVLPTPGVTTSTTGCAAPHCSYTGVRPELQPKDFQPLHFQSPRKGQALCVCYGSMGRGMRTGRASGTRNRHGGATRGHVHASVWCVTRLTWGRLLLGAVPSQRAFHP